ncbi:hypothetical protein [Kribbella italica]|uniref:Uncharacterized protein n=1 Tax=Kribbella italica TaxID=1540520 RepID=A0A7W9J144_9ACTN|nr:hypothetical protein [Kribbella italica]MBB5833706.1 hypothetical protein [Kribbella italica]
MVLLVALCLAGCSAGNDEAGGDEPAGGTTTTTTAPAETESTDEPSVEPTEPEKPQTEQNKPAIKNAKLPVGGQVEFDDEGKACFAPAWGSGELPSGVEILAVKYELTDTSVVKFGAGTCPEGPPCVEGTQFGSGAESCYLQLEKAGTGQTVLNIYGDVTCTSEDDCAKVQNDYLQAGGLTISVEGEGEESPSPSDG